MTSIEQKHYSPALIEEIAHKLGIQDEKIIAELAALLEEAATQYLWGAKHNNRMSKNKSDKEFKRLAKKMTNIRESFHILTKYSMSGLGDFEQGLYKLDKSNEAREMLLNLNRGEYFYTSERVTNLLESLEAAFVNASQVTNAVSFEKHTKTQVLLTWIWSIDEFWVAHSKVPITEGRYSEIDDKHVSKAIEIFDLMARPISKPWPITDSMLFQAIKLGRNPGNMLRAIDLSDAALEELLQ